MNTNRLSPFIKLAIIISFFFGNKHYSSAQEFDTLLLRTLESVEISGFKSRIQKVQALERLHDTYITSGKKSEVITIEGMPANLAEKTGRQIFAKIPGAFIYDMDGSGNQVNLSARGLDPHRSWEFNVRQNGIMTNSDIYGYPASHYSAPMEAIARIELIRGAGSLQYGAQFGGMINYITKQADTSKTLSLENITSVGSFGLFSNYTSIGGKKGNLSYFAYYQRRISNGYRDNANTDAQAQFAGIYYTASDKITLKFELARSQYLYKIPGPLTDQMFFENPKQATRSRNYFNPDIYIPSLVMDWKIFENTDLRWTISSVLGQRNSVQFIGFADTPDTINTLTGMYKNRQVDRDQFNSYTSELKLVHHYLFFSKASILSTGVRYINNDLHRRQLGVGSANSDFDLNITGDFGRDIHLKTQNIALFFENVFQITKYWDVSLGMRYENGTSKLSGAISYLDNKDVPKTIMHNFPLLGLSTQIMLHKDHIFYAGWAEAYRPVIFADLIPGNALEKTDQNLMDAHGYNLELGFRGKIKSWGTYHITAFQILYKNRVGTQILEDENQQPYVYKTNIGNTRTRGIELFAEFSLFSMKNSTISMFSSTSFMNAIYLNGALRAGMENIDLSGNALETVPQWISRNGLQYSSSHLSLILQHSYVASSYSDPFNTENPTVNGAAGKVPSYDIWDINAAYRVNDKIGIHVGVSNLFNVNYFTKRPSGYPGPGIWSSDGRGIIFSINYKI